MLVTLIKQTKFNLNVVLIFWNSSSLQNILPYSRNIYEFNKHNQKEVHY